MRFELDALACGIAWLGHQADDVATYRDSLTKQVAELPLSVNVVAKEKTFVEEVLGKAWWKPITDEKLEELVDRLGPLMRYRREKRELIQLDIEDLLAIKEFIEFGPNGTRMPISTYRERVETFIKDLAEKHPVLQKIRAGGTVSAEELEALGRVLETEELHVNPDILRRIYDQRTASFLQLMRHVLGLERLEPWKETVTRAFDEFIARHNTLNPQQILFLQTLRNFVLEKGAIAKKALVEAPFTQIHPNGIRGIFTPAEVAEILELTQKIAA